MPQQSTSRRKTRKRRERRLAKWREKQILQRLEQQKEETKKGS